jgi:hypothetical protein
MAMRRIAIASAMGVEMLDLVAYAVALFEQPRELGITARDGLRIGLDLVVHAGELGGQLASVFLHASHISCAGARLPDGFPTLFATRAP